MKNIFNQIFAYFEQEEFENKLSYSRKVNLILEFDEWIRKLPEDELYDLLVQCGADEEVNTEEARQAMLKGADEWLNNNHKDIFNA